MTVQKWGGLASFILVPALIVAPLIYLTGPGQDFLRLSAYDLADLLYGPVWAASLVTAVFALRERIGERGSNQMSLALIASALSAAMFVAAALLRASNRQYAAIHPELHLENSSTVLAVWTTLIAGVISTGWHFLGWALLLIASAGWKSQHLPATLCILYLITGVLSLLVYLLPDIEGLVTFLSVMWAIWQGLLLWQAPLEESLPLRENPTPA